MKASELKEKTVDQLKVDLLELLKVQFALRMQHATGQLGNTSELKNNRRKIARVKTILRDKGGK